MPVDPVVVAALSDLATGLRALGVDFAPHSACSTALTLLSSAWSRTTIADC
jgi:hypothetical protein